MAYMLCEKHGGNPASFVCRHTYDRVLHSLAVRRLTAVRTELEGQQFVAMLLCGDCEAQRKVVTPIINLEHLDDDLGLEEVLGIEPTQPVC